MALAPYLIAAILAIAAKAPTLNNGLLNIDEPQYLLQAEALNTLERFLHSFVYWPEMKFPLGLLPYSAAISISREHAVLLVHFFGLVAALASALLMVLLSRTVLASARPGLAAALMWLSYLNRGGPAAAPLLEYFQLPFLLSALWLFVQAQRSRQTWPLAAAGLCIGIAAGLKPPGIVVAGVLSAVIVAEWSGPLRRRCANAGVLCACAAAPILALVLPYLVEARTLSVLRSGFLEPALTYSPVTLDERFLRLVAHTPGESLILFVLCVAAGARWLVSRVLRLATCSPTPRSGVTAERPRREDVRVASSRLMLFVGLGLFAGYLTGAGFVQHLVPVIPFTALYIANWAITTYRGLTTVAVRVGFAVLVASTVLLSDLPNISYYVQLFGDNGKMYMSTMQGVDTRQLVRYVETHSKPGEPIWVYFEAPEIYWLSNRPMATDDPFKESLARSNPLRLRDSLLRDRPVIVVGIHEPRYQPSEGWTSLTSLPLVQGVLESDYLCCDDAVPGTTICRLGQVESSVK